MAVATSCSTPVTNRTAIASCAPRKTGQHALIARQCLFLTVEHRASGAPISRLLFSIIQGKVVLCLQ
jgi:hypothetical protein